MIIAMCANRVPSAKCNLQHLGQRQNVPLLDTFTYRSSQHPGKGNEANSRSIYF